MARPLEFDRADKLDRAVQFFWTHGLFSPTMSDLAQHLSLGRQSLYNAFGGLDDLRRESIERYSRTRPAFSLPPGRSLRDRFQRAFNDLIRRVTENPDDPGCMIVNAIGVMGDDAQLRKRVADHFQRLEEQVEAVIASAPDASRLNKSVSPARMAKHLVILLSGVRLAARRGVSAADLRQTVEIGLLCLPGTPNS